MQKIIPDIKLGFKDVMIIPKSSYVNSRSLVNLEVNYTFSNNITWSGVPIVVSNMDTTGTFKMAKALFPYKCITCLHKFYSIKEINDFCNTLEHSDYEYFAISSGISSRDLEILKIIIFNNPKIKWICIDIANGHLKSFIDVLRQIRLDYPDKLIIAGNIVWSSKYCTMDFIKHVDVIKAGIGGGSVCTTRVKTGIGYPQLGTIIDVKNDMDLCKTANPFTEPNYKYTRLMSDGGCSTPSDICKAFGAGADFVMLGGMFAGHNESGSEELIKVDEDGTETTYLKFYGMSSTEAMHKHYGKQESYRTSEGKSVLIKSRGPVEHTINDILGSLRSSCTYVNATNLQEYYNNVLFIRVNEQENKLFNK